MEPIKCAVQLELANGEIRTIAIGRFKAMDGWDIQNRYFDFVTTSNKSVRRAYVMEVLSHAFVIIGDSQMQITTAAVIESHLQSGPAIQEVFEAVLIHNGIEPMKHADRPGLWESVGTHVAVAFMAEASRRLGPALKTVTER